MHQRKSKKILLYFFLFLILGTINNKSLNQFKIPKINEITVIGLDEKNNIKLEKNLNFLLLKNLFFLDDLLIKEIINSNNLVEKYFVFKNYPSSINIKIYKTNFLAKVNKDNKVYLLGSNGKLIKSEIIDKDIPFIFGEFNNKSFFQLKKIIDTKSFENFEIKNFYFFKSGRWDIETKSGLLMKLPKDNVDKALELIVEILRKDSKNKISKIDLRQQNQIIIDE
jgi:cell division protein FtsQ